MRDSAACPQRKVCSYGAVFVRRHWVGRYEEAAEDAGARGWIFVLLERISAIFVGYWSPRFIAELQAGKPPASPMTQCAWPYLSHHNDTFQLVADVALYDLSAPQR